jgi:hypothetical protein
VVDNKFKVTSFKLLQKKGLKEILCPFNYWFHTQFDYILKTRDINYFKSTSKEIVTLSPTIVLAIDWYLGWTHKILG